MKDSLLPENYLKITLNLASKEERRLPLKLKAEKVIDLWGGIDSEEKIRPGKKIQS